MKAWKIVAAVVAVLVIGVVVFVATFDIGQYKGLIQDQAKAATGREVVIGDIHMGLSLTPTVILTDVTVANAPWGTGPHMAVIEKVEATAELLPLLSGKVNISKIDAQGVNVLLETNKQGVGNWEFSTQGKDVAPTGDAQQSTALNIGAIDGSDLKVTYKDGKTGGQIDAALKSIAAKLTGAVQDLNVTSLTMNDATVTQREGANALQASIGKVNMQAGGSLKDFAFKTVEVSDVKVAGKGESALNAEVSKLTLGGDGALDMQAKYNGGDIRAKGTLTPITALKGKKELPLKLSLEGLGLKGDVDLTVDTGRTPIFVKGNVTIPELDMAAFGGKSGAAAAPVAKGQAGSSLFPSDALPWDSLNSIDADVKVSVATLKLAKGPPLTNAVLPVKLSKGHLIVNGASVDIVGGKIEASVDANADGKSVALKGGAKGLTAEGLAKAYGKDVVDGGPLTLALDVRGAGVSPQAIAASLNGSFLADMGESKIDNSAMNVGGGAQMLLGIITASNPLAKQEPYTVAKCAVANFQIAGGVASTQNGLAFITDKVQGTGTGKIDLGQNRVDMIVKPTVSGGLGSQLGKLVSTVKITGTVDNPSYGVDAASTATAVVGLAAGVATGGAAGGLLGLSGGDKANSSGGLLGAIGGVFGGGKQQTTTQTASAAPADVCAAARAKR